MATLATLHSRVSSRIRRGTVFDSAIPTYMADAALMIERNHTFEYMKQRRTFDLKYQATYPRYLPLPATRYKTVDYIRLKKSTDWFITLERLEDERAFDLVYTREPRYYWIEGETRIVLDSTPQEDYDDSVIRYSAFTDWPSATDQEPRLAALYANLLVNETILLMGPEIRNPQLIQEIRQQVVDEWNRIHIAQDEQQHGQKNSAMEYTIDYDNLYRGTATSA